MYDIFIWFVPFFTCYFLKKLSKFHLFTLSFLLVKKALYGGVINKIDDAFLNNYKRLQIPGTIRDFALRTSCMQSSYLTFLQYTL